MKKASKLKALSESAAANKPRYQYRRPDPRILETFKSPFKKNFSGNVHIEVPEVTSLCPITGQPDFAKIIIDYVPNQLCVESKSLKLYLMGFRGHGEFHESCCQRIAYDLVKILDPMMLLVKGEFTPRGGIPFWPTVRYYRISKSGTFAVTAEGTGLP